MTTTDSMTAASGELQQLCEQGQERLMATDYWAAEHVLARAEQMAWDARDFDTLARLYMPLQEARRQRRQQCGEGVVALDLVSEGEADTIDPVHVVSNYPHGQLLVAGWGTIEPAVRVRQLAERNGLYLETFLAATYPVGAGKAVVIVPTAAVALPGVRGQSIDELIRELPAHSIVLSEDELPRGVAKGTPQTYARTMEMWERLHGPFLAMADGTRELIARMEGYRRTIGVDYACELAHQKLSDVAKELERTGRARNHSATVSS
jgi:hypothetical protein